MKKMVVDYMGYMGYCDNRRCQRHLGDIALAA